MENYQIKILGAFAAQLKAEKTGTSGGRFLDPNETFGNNGDEKSPEEEKPKEEPPRKKITRKTEKKPGDGGGGEGSDKDTVQ